MAASASGVTPRFADFDEATCTAEEGEERTLAYILHLEKELTKAKARLSVYRAQARVAERKRLSTLRGFPLTDSPEVEEPADKPEDKPKGEEPEGQSEGEAEKGSEGTAKVKPEARRRAPPVAREPEPKRKRATALPKGVCLGCYQTVQRGIPGYSHQYELESCTFTPTRSPQRSRALERRQKGKEAREEAERKRAAEGEEVSRQSSEAGPLPDAEDKHRACLPQSPPAQF